MPKLTPLTLRDVPALIETVFPAQKVSFEAQRERTAGPAQTLTALGAYWKGRKPLILVRSIVLGSLLPQSGDSERDLEIFEKLMAFDNLGLARRALKQNVLKPKDIANSITLHNPWDYFSHNVSQEDSSYKHVRDLEFPIDCDEEGISIRWRREVEDEEKMSLFVRFMDNCSSYLEKSAFCKRPEEVDQSWLYEPVWSEVNSHYAYLGIEAFSHKELVEQLGILRFGHTPKVGDTFCGGGSIPFESARLGCDAYASDLNPVACMLTWGAKNIIGVDSARQEEISIEQQRIVANVEKKLSELSIEENADGDKIRILLYCLETVCPESGWTVPILPTFIVSTRSSCIMKLTEDYKEKRFDIEILNGVSKTEVASAKKGTLQNGSLIYSLDGRDYKVPIKTLRGDYRDTDGKTRNRLRRWEKQDFKPKSSDIYQERLYAIQWIRKDTLDTNRPETYFASISDADIARERKVESIVANNLVDWQEKGLVPDMEIEPGYNTNQIIRERAWTYWHHLFSPRQLLVNAITLEESTSPESRLFFARILDFNSKLTTWVGPSNRDKNNNTFSQQKLSTLFSRAERGWSFLSDTIRYSPKEFVSVIDNLRIQALDSNEISDCSDIWITDPPYADAVNYHEITEYFIAWLRKNPPISFERWTWDSRRALAITGSGDSFRQGMVKAYSAMTEHMPDNGMQCVMFTHQDTGVWSDMVGIFWAAGLQVVGAWYIATETTSELKKGGYVQGTVILMLRKRPEGEKSGFKQRVLPAVRNEVKAQIEKMMHLNQDIEQKLGEPVFNDSDLQMAGYAAALKVLTAYTHIGGEDVTSFALHPRQRGEVTIVDEIVQQAAEAANSLLVPEGLAAETWQRISGIQRFYLRMMDIETTGAAKLDNYQNFAKAFRVDDYAKVMGSMTANKARLRRASEFTSRDLTDSTELGTTWLGRLIIGMQQLLADTEPQVVIGQLQAELPDFMEVRPLLIDQLQFFQVKAPEQEVRQAAEVLANRLRNLRALGQ